MIKTRLISSLMRSSGKGPGKGGAHDILSALSRSARTQGPKDIVFAYDLYRPGPLTREDRYPSVTPPDGTVNKNGEVEYLGGATFGIHWFVETDDAVWHVVTAGDTAKEPILFVHGYPETWWSWSGVMRDLADDYYVIAVDTLGYGQSSKGPRLDLSYGALAQGLARLMEELGFDRFCLVGHDRGAIMADHMVARDEINPRIKAYLRMQQTANEPHGLPRPPHGEMARPEFHAPENLYDLFATQYYSVDLPLAHQDRAVWEFGFPGTAEAAARQFSHADFDTELEHRLAEVFPRMGMPVLFLQGAHDPGQHPEEYADTASMVPHGRVIIADASHFPHTEKPEMVADIARAFFDKHR